MQFLSMIAVLSLAVSSSMARPATSTTPAAASSGMDKCLAHIQTAVKLLAKDCKEVKCVCTDATWSAAVKARNDNAAECASLTNDAMVAEAKKTCSGVTLKYTF